MKLLGPVVCSHHRGAACLGGTSDSRSLNIQAAWTTIRWERALCESDRADTNGPDARGLQSRQIPKPLSGRLVCRDEDEFVCVARAARVSACLSDCAVTWEARTHVQHMFPRATGLAGQPLRFQRSGLDCVAPSSELLPFGNFPLTFKRNTNINNNSQISDPWYAVLFLTLQIHGCYLLNSSEWWLNGHIAQYSKSWCHIWTKLTSKSAYFSLALTVFWI